MKKYVIPAVIALAITGVTLTGCGKKENQTDTHQATEKLSIKGSVAGANYKNDYFKVSFQAPEGWKLYDFNNEADRKEVEKISGNTNSDTTFIDMYAQKGNNNVSVVVYKADAIGGFSVTSDFLVDDLIKSLKSDLSKTGLENPQVEKTKVTFAGKEVSAVKQVGKYNGMNIYSTQCLFPKDSYVESITVTCVDSDFAQDIFNSFNELN